MSRSIHPDTVAALAQDNFGMVAMLTLDFSTPLHLTEAQFPVEHGGITYLPSAHLQALGTVSETADLRVGTFRIELGMAEQSFIALFLTNDYIDVPVQYSKAILDDAHQVVGEPILLFDGTISGWQGDEKKGASKLTIECASHWANFEKKAGRLTNDTSQQAIFPGDLGMQYAAHTKKQVSWGRK